VSPRGYWDFNFRAECASGLYRLGTDRDEWWEDTPLEGSFEFVLGSDLRSVSIGGGGLGLREGRRCDMTDGDLEDGKEDRDVLR
jgi:hypothetical protein